MVPVIYIIGFVLIILYYNLSFVIPLRKLMADLGGKINYKFEGVFTFQGRDFFIKYIPGSRSRSPELKIYTHGSFGAEMLIRLENSFDKFYKAIGLNVEQSIPDRMGSDKLYYECDDQDFLNLIFSNTKAKTDVLDLLRKYSAIVITKDSCQLNQYPVPDLSTITKDEILKSALELSGFVSLVSSVGGNNPELTTFKIKKVIFYFLGAATAALGVVSLIWSSFAFMVVDVHHLWLQSLHYSLEIAVVAVVLAYFLIKGFSTSSKAFVFFLLTFSIGIVLCARFGTVVYNGLYDRSTPRSFDQLIIDKHTTTSKGRTSYHVLLEPWNAQMKPLEIRVTPAAYSTVYPGSSLYHLMTKSGRLGIEWIFRGQVKDYEYRDFSYEPHLSGYVNSIDLNGDHIDIPINPMLVLNGKNKDAIMSLRQLSVEKITNLIPVNYQPSQEIFGKIVDGKPWWGMLGICYFGNGPQSIEGPSRESQYIVNPYLLMGVESPLAFRVKNTYLKPKEIYPVPLKLTWDPKGAWGHAIYNVHDYYNNGIRYKYWDVQNLYLKDYNARDFGFNYFVIDAALSKNISGSTGKVIPIIQFIHQGGSCGYPGGCNNMSPHQEDLILRWTDLPARIYIKLWRNKVDDRTQKADMDFIVDLE